LALAQPDRLVLPFAMTGSRELLPPAVREQSSPPSAEELSPGELRVLRYLPTNLSRPEIAGELSVSPNTVSAHICSIYAKLQVRDRSSAVQRARELRLPAAGRTR
jgi:LuxR family transcriptional regulator, maltose regulon positive regulatory protein